jgi:5-formyltetrahydrofolate cyclo-ligase
VHDVQIVEEIPQDAWDVRVDVIVTPTKTIRVA